MRKLVISLVSTMLALSSASVSAPGANAASLSSCLMITNAKATISGLQVTVSADIYQTCKNFTPSSGSISVFAFSPSYTTSLSGLTCNGPMLRGELISLPLLGYPLGSVKCTGTTTSTGVSRSTISATLEGRVDFSFSHSLISAPVVKPKPIAPTQSAPTQSAPTQSAPTPEPTKYVESLQTTTELKELEVAYQTVTANTVESDSALASAIAVSASIAKSIEIVNEVMDGIKARLALMIELLQTYQGKARSQS